MQLFFVYLLKVIIYSGIGFGYYHIALRNKRFHYYNRFYLLMSVVLSLALPFLQLRIWHLNSDNPQVINLADIMVTSTSEPENAGHSLSLSFNNFIILAYCCIVVCLLLSFASGLLKIIGLKKKFPSERIGNVLFINTDLPQAPFSFFKNLFWKNSIDISEETGNQIFRHELAHIEQKHSSDKLFMQLVTLVFWINPFYWLMQKELSLIHEFIADEKAIDNKDAEAFALMLLQSQFGKNTFLPLQSFSYSPIKRRFRMLTSSSKTSHSYARRILALPVLSLTVLLFAFKLNDRQPPSAVSHTNAPFILVVDAGHGGTDNGAVGLSDEVEKGFNLSIAKKVAELAPQYGITARMTRTEDVTVSLQDRMNIIKREQPDAFISIHVNATPGTTSEDAFQVFITKNNTSATYQQSRLLGSSLIQSVKTNFPVDDAIQQRRQGIYVIDQNPYPAAIIECGYINNPKSLEQITTDAGVEKVAKDILEGVVAYANAKQESSVISPDTTGKQPLYILDGKEISAEDMKKLNTADIESVSVLKDKEAIAKYGKKGENGVVLIAMKKAGTGIAGSVQADAYAKTLQNVQNGNYTKALKLIDDKIVSNDEFNKVNPDRIDKAFVLDAKAATKQYGDKGKNGAILVTMKKEDGSQPAADTEIKARNAEAFTGIYIVDGKEISKEDFDKQKLQPGDIDNISVWKGEEAIKKYGEKGRNGVIVITSKNKLSAGSVSGNNPPE